MSVDVRVIVLGLGVGWCAGCVVYLLVQRAQRPVGHRRRPSLADVAWPAVGAVLLVGMLTGVLLSEHVATVRP